WHQRQDASRFYANGIMTQLLGNNGDPVGFIKIVRDDTESHLMNAQIEAHYKREQRIAETFQRALLEDIAEDAFNGLAVKTFYVAAWHEAMVGGDFYDIFALPGGAVALVIGDASGKGLQAAERTAEVK